MSGTGPARRPRRDDAVEQVHERVAAEAPPPEVRDAGASDRAPADRAPRPAAAPASSGTGRTGSPTARRLRALLTTPRGLRQAVLAAEVLGPPKAATRSGRRPRP